MTTSSGMMVLFLYCYFGKIGAESMNHMSDYVFDLNWHELTPNLQKYIILMLMDMQMPLYYHGFELATLDLNTFLRVSACKFHLGID